MCIGKVAGDTAVAHPGQIRLDMIPGTVDHNDAEESGFGHHHKRNGRFFQFPDIAERAIGRQADGVHIFKGFATLNHGIRGSGIFKLPGQHILTGISGAARREDGAAQENQ